MNRGSLVLTACGVLLAATGAFMCWSTEALGATVQDKECVQKLACGKVVAGDCAMSTGNCANHTCASVCPQTEILACKSKTGATCNQTGANACGGDVPQRTCEDNPRDGRTGCTCVLNDPPIGWVACPQVVRCTR